MQKFSAFLLILVIVAWSAKPMESIENYNVILVHGAADKRSGLDCSNGDNGGKIEEAADYISNDYINGTDYLNRIGGYKSWAGFWDDNFHGGTLFQMDKAGATGMVKYLRKWLTENIFEDDKSKVYLQRPFTNPANSPFANGQELGDKTWKGKNYCAERRSLIEEAQEVIAESRKELVALRESATTRSDLPPSRNILIAHSMGGVASREYVQGDDYNNDVDKVITLDSPHKGTHSLDGLLHLKDWIVNPTKEAVRQAIVAALAWGLAMVAIDGGPPSDYQSLIWIALGIAGVNSVNAVLSATADLALGYDYDETDPLVSYIRPGSYSLDKLNSKPYNDNLPMMRIQSSTGGLTFGSNKEYAQNLVSIFAPDALYVPLKNIIAQISHTEVNGVAYLNNIVASTYLGMVGGLSLTDHGSALIPHWSGAAENVSALDNYNGNSKFYTFEANESATNPSFIFFDIISPLIAMEIARKIGILNKPLAEMSRLAIAVASGVGLSLSMIPSSIAAGMDMQLGHRMPILEKYQSEWKGTPNTYSKISGGQETIKPYLMEEFLYEKPFVSLRVTSINDTLENPSNDNLDSIGLIGTKQDTTFAKNPDGTDDLTKMNVVEVLAPLVAVKPEVTNGRKLLFINSPSDWGRLGVKKERWERVNGVDGENTVPIRHADRYAVPDIVVTEFIEGYRFIVDDLMPHRLRQIRINFNYREEIAWDCDIDKAENAADACDFYMRTPESNEWLPRGKKAHPVKKDGTFEFKARDYYNSLGVIQKDNQNTVTISTINKIGLSNTQRFSYLFKATADLIEPLWPVYNARLTSAAGFQLHASVLSYQGFWVESGEDQIKQDISVDNKDNNIVDEDYKSMNIDKNGSDAILTSRSSIASLKEGNWLWHYKVETEDSSGTGGTVWTGSIPFVIDATPPAISLSAKEELNPGASTFIGRLTNHADSTGDKSLRAVYMRLDKIENEVVKKSYELPLLANVIAHEFGINWNGIDTSQLEDGSYRFTALAFDGAVGSASQYKLLNDFVGGLKNVSDLLIDASNLASVQSGINSDTSFVNFVIDRTAPVIESFELSAVDSGSDKPPISLDGSEIITLNKDRLLRMEYTISELLYERDSTQIHLSWEFLDKKDGSVLHRLGEGLVVKNDLVSFYWEENAQMQLPDGDYIVRMLATDAAGNQSPVFSAEKSLHVDRVAPVIEELIASNPVYYEPPTDGYKATLYVKQRDEIEANRSNLKCYYRLSGPNFQGKEWIYIAENNQTASKENITAKIDFVMNYDSIGTAYGKRYLEGGCIDAAGNFASAVDIFHIGHLTPSITYPKSSDAPDQSIISIRGIAPVPGMVTGDGKAAYSLRWRAKDAEGWSTEGIDIGAGKRLNDTTLWISNETQPIESDLGFWDRSALPPGTYSIELSTRSCGTCDWVSEIVEVLLATVNEKAEPAINIAYPSSIVGGEKTELSVSLDGGFENDFRIRFYGSDASGRPLFEASANKIKENPFKGKSSVSGNGIWFWEEEGKYHLQWNGLPSTDSLIIAYKNGSIEDICKNEAGQNISGCSEISWAEISKEAEQAVSNTLNSTFASLAEFSMPVGLNRAISLSGSSGHLVFQSKEAFYVNLGFEQSLAVHLGAKKTMLSDFMELSKTYIFQVNSAFYGFTVPWNGLTSTGHYPSAGIANLDVEIFENISGGIALRSSKRMQIEQPALKIVSSEADVLADFYVVSQGEQGLKLGSKTLSYGISGRDAIVSAWVENESGERVRNLLSEVRQNAILSSSAYKILWNGKNSDDFVVDKEGNYKFVISAKELNGNDADVLSRSFKLTIASSMQLATGDAADINGSAIKVAEATPDINDPERQNYSPTADYLINADLSGYTLPDSLRTATISYELGGTQVAQGYTPQRFNLTVNRQRDSLNLIIFYRVRATQYTMETPSCMWKNMKDPPHYGTFEKTFKATSLSDTIKIEYSRETGYGFSEEDAFLDVWAVLPKDYAAGNYKNAKSAIEDGIANGSLTSVWNATINIPKRDGDNNNVPYNPPEDSRCQPKDSDDAEPCSKNGLANDNYDPNANLFNLLAIPGGSDGKFRTDRGKIYSISPCKNRAARKIKIKLYIEIPLKEYWNAGYGYDNLVNRTIRLDHANKSIFGNDGFLKAYYDSDYFKNNVNTGLYFDGSDYKINTNYGMLTPFEVQSFRFESALNFPSGSNVFLFPDEANDSKYLANSYFKAKFYNIGEQQGSFKAYINWKGPSGTSVTSELKQNQEIETGLMAHGATTINVVLESNPSYFPSDIVQIPYPADFNWIDGIDASNAKVCSDYTDSKWRDISSIRADCLKFYEAGSKVHYYQGDYDDATWESAMLTKGKIFKNLYNTSGFSMKANSPETMLGLDTTLFGSKAAGSAIVNLKPENYDEKNKKFYMGIDEINYPSTVNSNSPLKLAVENVDASEYSWNEATGQLLFNAEEWNENLSYRYTNHQGALFPSVESPEPRLSLMELYTHQYSIENKDSLYTRSGINWLRNPWIHGVSMSNAKLTQLDSANHTHFYAEQQDSSVVLKLKSPPDSIRPAELVAIQGRVPGKDTQYQILYIVNGKDSVSEAHTLKSGVMGSDRGSESTPPLLSWFDVNRLQGNTSLFLTWGGESGNLMYRKLDLYVGNLLNGSSGVVKSLFGEVSVTFPEGALPATEGATVRTVAPEDYAFTTFNNVSLRGPVVEVLPSMTFEGPDYPRVKSRIPKADLGNIAPERVRLYKVDFENGQFVPLQNTLIGFLKADGSPAIEHNGEAKMCEPSAINNCGATDNWAYLLVSAETHTFSVFAALDSFSIAQNPISFAVSPELSENIIREIKVSGVDNYRIYISDNSKWNAEGALQTLAELEMGANGGIFVSLPNRLDSWLYLVALNENGEELSSLPVSVNVKLIPSEIACSIPEEDLWLGLDNGYLELAHECNQPVMGTLQIRKDGNTVAEHSQAFPGALIWDGKIGINKISHGIYSSRYIAVGTTGQGMQIIGPSVYTDTLRPSISNFIVEESSALIDREYKIQANISDDYSGISSIRLAWQLSEAISGTVNINADSAGNIIYTLRIPRKQLAQCVGCRLNISLKAEDMGRNYSEEEWQSDRLWPYPADLALWYPAQEGGGKTAKEYTETGHDLDLLMQTPWLSASGIYFEKSEDKALGKGQVDLGRADSYTLEAWVRPGHVSGSSWNRIFGFQFADGRRVDLQTKGSDVRLLDGVQAWSIPNLLSQPKAWSHLTIAVDGSYARFYIDGELAGSVAATPSERIWLGNFSLGLGYDAPSFAGHLMQIRMYKRALEADEVHALFTGAGLGESGSRIEIVLAGDLDWKTDGVDRGFSCAVPGSSYWETSKESTLSWRAWAEQAASYRIFLYARSAQPGNKTVKAGASGGTLLTGTISLESVWRPVALDGIALPLKAGFNDIELRLPADIDIAGIALSDNSSLLPSQISWKSESNAVSSSTVYAQVRFEGHPDPSMIRPRIRLQNISSATIYGPKVRYYFRGEDPAQVMSSKFYPQEGELIVRQEGDNLGYAQWSFPETTALPSGELLFWGEGPHFGLHNTNYTPWVVSDDPSFAEGSSNAYVDAPGIVVLDIDNKVLSGSCFENEQPLITTPVVQVLARDSRAGDNQASQLYIKLENIGQVPIKNYEVRYSFYVSGNATPVLDVYDMQGLSASLNSLGSGRWQVVVSGAASLGPGISWANPAQFALHLPNWQSGWNTGDDPSYEGISAEWALAKGIEVFDSLGNRIYGKEPSWTTEIAENPNTSSSSSENSNASYANASVRVMAKETKMHESNSSAVRFYVENLGLESMDGFEVRYWFSVAQGKQAGYQIYSNTQFAANIVNEGNNMYSARFAYNGGLLAPGAKTEWGEGLELFIYHSDWSAYDKESDFSHNGLGTEFSEANYIAVYNSEGNLIWGTEPVIPEEINSAPPIEIVVLPDGLLISLQENSVLRLDLVNAAGMPQKFLYQGALSAGTHTIFANWSNVDFAKTYLVVRLNGQISSQLISKFEKLGN